MKVSILFASAATSVFLGLSATSAAAVSIVNGGFEADAASVPPAGVFEGAITGWSYGALISAGYYSAAPPEGSIFALVGGGTDTSNYHLSQTITGLTPGQAYSVRFALGGEEFKIPHAVEQVNVWISAGSASASQIFSAPLSSNNVAFGAGPLWDNWGYFNYDFVANANSATINFEQTAATSASGDTGLDNVSISAATPEPATWGMLLVGFGLVGGAMRRRAAATA